MNTGMSLCEAMSSARMLNKEIAMNVINMTPHAIVVEDASGVRTTFQPSGSVPRLATSQEVVGRLFGVEVRRTVYGEIEGLPAPQEGVVYLVSGMVAAQARRGDVVAPDTGPTAVRENGQVIAVKGFVTF